MCTRVCTYMYMCIQMPGDGTLAKVGIEANGKFKAPVNNRPFDTQYALDLHLKYLHDPKKCNPNIEE